MAAKFDGRPIGIMLGAPLACELSPFSSALKEGCNASMTAGAYKELEDQRRTLAGYLADLSRGRRERGIVNADVSMMSFGYEQVQQTCRGRAGRVRAVPEPRAGGGPDGPA